jgi:hypothetical protein
MTAATSKIVGIENMSPHRINATIHGTPTRLGAHDLAFRVDGIDAASRNTFIIATTPSVSPDSANGLRAMNGVKRKNVTTFAEDTSERKMFMKDEEEICSRCERGA